MASPRAPDALIDRAASNQKCDMTSHFKIRGIIIAAAGEGEYSIQETTREENFKEVLNDDRVGSYSIDER